MLFDLFLSFSSLDRTIQVDGRRVNLIEELKRALESHSKPNSRRKLRRRRFRVCTYEEDFEIRQTVRDAMRETIKSCGALLVISSPSASRSDSVNFELNAFLEFHGSESLLAARLSLDPEQAFPKVFTEDHLAANLSSTPEMTLREWRLQLQKESHKVVARVWGMPLDEVYDRFEAQRKWARKVVVRSSAAALLVGLAVLTWYYSDIGFHQVSVFRGEGSDYYPVLGGFTGSTDDEFVSFHVRHLHKWHIRNPDNSERVEIDGVPTQAVVADATTAVIARGSELFRLDFGSGQTTLLFQVRQPIREIAVANNQWVVGSGERMFVGTMDGQVRQAPSRFNIRGSFQELRYGERVVFCSNGRWVANAALSGNLVVLNPDTWGWFDSNNPVVYSAPDNRNITALVCDEKSRRLFFFERPRGIGVFSFDDGQVRKLNTPEIGFVDHAAVTPGGEYLMAKTGTTLHWFQRNGEEYAHVDQQNGDASNLTNLLASPSGSFFLASGYRDHATLYKRTLRMFNIDLPIPWQ